MTAPSHFRNPLPIRLLELTIRIYPVAWIIGFGAIVPSALIFMAALGTALTSPRNSRVRTDSVLLIAFVLVYLTALFAATMESPGLRVVASAYNLTVWVSGFLCLYVVNAHRDEASHFGILRAIRDAGVISALIGFAGLLMWRPGVNAVTVPSILAIVVPALKSIDPASLLGESIQPLIVRADWILPNLAIPRVVANHPYPNALALALVLAIASHMILRQYKKNLRSIISLGSVLDRVYMFILVVALILTMSRIVFIGVAAVWLVALLARGRTRSLKILYGASLMAAIGIYGFLWAVDTGLLSLVENFRAASSAARLSIYRVTFDLFMERPLIGWGIKPDPETIGLSFRVPIGSHSTLMGVLLKTGIAGTVPVLIYFVRWAVIAIKRVVWGSKEQLVLAGTVLIGLLWALVEDIDAPIFAAVMYFSWLGMFQVSCGSRPVTTTGLRNRPPEEYDLAPLQS